MGRTLKYDLQKCAGEGFNRDSLQYFLDPQAPDDELFALAGNVRGEGVGNRVWFRGLIEFSNICSKDCFYCGIRRSNRKVERYDLSDAEILDAARFAYDNGYGSVVLQSGEVTGDAFVSRIERLLRQIKKIGAGALGITLSLGEQTAQTYRRWFGAGAHRYLLRVETTNPVLYERMHPRDGNHSLEKRLECLHSLRNEGYQVGTGVMIGLPFQTPGDLADDLLFFRGFDVDMVGMGPYVSHADTPLYSDRELLWPDELRFRTALRMVALLRIMMPDINIAAATALQALDPMGREKAVRAGANIVMPNITPGCFRNHYQLYENKPCVEEEPSDCLGCLEARISLAGCEVVKGEWGDSKHFTLRSR